MRTTRWRCQVAVTVAVLLGAAACGEAAGTGTDGGAGVASLDDSAGSDAGSAAEQGPTSDVEAPDDPELAFALYDECMGDAGFDFGGTVIAGDDATGGAIEIDELEIDDEDPQAVARADAFGEDFQAAEEVCRAHLANLDIGFDLSPEQQAAMEDAQLAWRQCMEEQGFDIPELDGSGGGAIVVEIGPDDEDPQASSFDDHDFEALQSASQACDHAFDDLELGELGTVEASP